MSADRFPSLREDLSAEPLHAEIQAALRRLIESGHSPKAVTDAAFATTSALALDSDGLVATATHLMRVGATLARACPEVQQVASEFSAVLSDIARHVAAGIEPPTAH